MTSPFLDLLGQPTKPEDPMAPKGSFMDLVNQSTSVIQSPTSPKVGGWKQDAQEGFKAGWDAGGTRGLRNLGAGLVQGAAALTQLPKNLTTLMGADPASIAVMNPGMPKVFDFLDTVNEKLNKFASYVGPQTPSASKSQEFADKGEQIIGSLFALGKPFSMGAKGVEKAFEYAPTILKARGAQAVIAATRGITNPKLQAGVAGALASIPAEVTAGVAGSALLDPKSVNTPEGLALAAGLSVPGIVLKGWQASNPNPVLGIFHPDPIDQGIAAKVRQNSAAVSAMTPDEARFAAGQFIGQAPKPYLGFWQDVKNFGGDLERKIFTGKAGFRQLGKEAGSDISFEDRANLLSGTSKIQHEAIYGNTPMLLDEATGSWVPSGDKGLDDLFKLVAPEDISNKTFQGYLLARHRLDPGVEGQIRMGNFEHPMTRGLAQMAVLNPKPGFEDAAKIFDKMNEINRRNALNAGLIDLPTFDFIDQNYQAYASASRALANTDNVAPLVKRKGSESHAMVDPLQALVAGTKQTISKARINQFANKVMDHALADPDAMKGMIDVVPEGRIFDTKTVDQIQEGALREGFSIPQTLAEALASTKRVGDFDPSSGKMLFLRDGRPYALRINEDLKEGFSMFQPDPSVVNNPIVKAARPLEKVPRTATSLFLDLSGMGTWKDTFAAYINAPREAGLNPLQILTNPARGLAEIKRKGPYYYEMIGEGGGLGGRFIGEGAIDAKKSLDLVQQHAQKNGIKFAVQHPLLLAEQLSADLSNSTRMGMYMRLRDGGMSATQAAVEARRVLADPFQSGSSQLIKAFAASTSFGNTGLQEVRNLARVAAKDPSRVALKGLIGVAIPSAIAWARAELTDDQQIREMRNAPGGEMFDFWRINGKVIGTPRPGWAMGQVFGTGMDTFLDKAIKGEDNKKRWAEGFLNQISVNTIPIAVQQLYSMKSGQQFMGPLGPSIGLTPGAQAGMDPMMQGTSKTSEAAKYLSKEIGLDPFRWDRVMKGLLTPDGYKVEQLLERAASTTGIIDAKHTDLQASDIPLIQRYVKPYPTTNVASMRTFYDDYSKYSMVGKTLEGLEKQGRFDEHKAYFDQHIREAVMAPMYVEMATEVASLRKLIELTALQPEEAFPAKDKQLQIDRLTEDMISMVRDFNKATRNNVENDKKKTVDINFMGRKKN